MEVVISLQTVRLLSIICKLDECFRLRKGTVWRGITDIHVLLRIGNYTRKI